MPQSHDTLPGTGAPRRRLPRAVLFDLWGTVIRSAEFKPLKGNAALLAVARNERGVSLETVQELGARIVASTEPRELESWLEFTHASLLRMLTDAYGLSFSLPPLELEWIFWSAALHIHPTAGIREALASLRRRGILTCIVSNSSFMAATLERELERHGLLGSFSFVVSSADYGVRKPDPLIFEIALRRLGVPAGEAWFAGDNVEYDIEGAWGAGLFPIAYNADRPVPEHVREHRAISHWDELDGLIEGA